MCHGVLEVTLFGRVPDNNSLKLILWQFMSNFGAVFCYYAYFRV